jgi:hypothetical protein
VGRLNPAVLPLMSRFKNKRVRAMRLKSDPMEQLQRNLLDGNLVADDTRQAGVMALLL